MEIEKNGKKRFVTACNYPIEDGLVVRTATPAVLDIRRMIAELLLSRCPKEKQIQDLAREYGVIEPRFKLEEEKCILCGLCCRVCGEMVGVFAINFQNRGTDRSVGAPYGELSEESIACGACLWDAPTSAISLRETSPLTAERYHQDRSGDLSGERDADLGCAASFSPPEQRSRDRMEGLSPPFLLDAWIRASLMLLWWFIKRRIMEEERQR